MHLGGNRHWVPLSFKIQIHCLHIVCQTLFYITLKEYLYENQVVNNSNNVPLPINNGMQVCFQRAMNKDVSGSQLHYTSLMG